MIWKDEFKKWASFNGLESSLKEELFNLEGNEKKIEERFYKSLEFATAGMHGELGAGTNRMNIYTVRKASEGLARYIEEKGEEAKTRGVAIAYDSRHQSPEFALEVAKTVGNHDIQAYLFDSLQPTPLLSFAVRYLNAFAGVVITASHNPKEYNVVACTAGFLLLIDIFLKAPLIGIVVPIFFFVMSNAMISTSSFSLAMQSQGHRAGSAAALLGLKPFILGSITSPLVGVAGEHSAIPMGIIIFFASFLALLSYYGFVRNTTVQKLNSLSNS